METLWLGSALSGFPVPCFQARCGHLLSQAPPLRVARQSPPPPACSPLPDHALPGPGSGHRTSGFLEGCPGPPWAQRWSHCSTPGAILDAGSSSSAPIYARRCWRSPLMTRYLPAAGSLWILFAEALLRPWAQGGIPLSPEGGPGGGPKSACVIRKDTWSETLWNPGQ